MRLLSLALVLLSLPAVGQPLDDPQILKLARSVHTAPGRLPQLTTKGAKLPLIHTKVYAELHTQIARVEITQTYRNDNDQPIEAVYTFPLPENSAVDDLKIRVGDRIIQAEIQRRDQAKRTYEAAKRKGHTAALLEQERPNVFTQSVANIPPGESIEIHVRYVQTLSYDAGEYEFVFPMVVGPRFIPGAPSGAGMAGSGWAPNTLAVPDAARITPPIVGAGTRSGHDIELEVVLDPGLPLIDLQTPTHATDTRSNADETIQIAISPADRLPNRDFVLRYRLAGSAPQVALHTHRDGKDGHFMLVLQPPQLDVEALVGRREMVFVVDVSGSMRGAPLAQAKATMAQALPKLRPVDTFNVFTFAGRTARLWPVARPANQTNIREAQRWLERVRAGGGTHLSDAVKQALNGAGESDRHRYVFFLTDGYVGNEATIFDGARTMVAHYRAAGRTARVFTLGVGSSVNRHLLDGLAKAGKGLATYLTLRETPHAALNRMFRVVDHSVLTDVRVDWGGLKVEAIEPGVLPDLFASHPLVLFGRFSEPAEGTITLHAKQGDTPWTLKVPVVLPRQQTHGAAVATLWARARIAGLSERLWRGHDQDAVDQITALGLGHRLVTRYTSFVAVDRSRVVGKGTPKMIVQPIEAPEGVDAVAAGARRQSAHRLGGVLGNMQGAPVGDVGGFGGLGLVGTGSGGGGVGYGRGGVGSALGGRGRASRTPRVRAARATVTGSLHKDVIRRVMRRHRNRFRRAYEKSLKSNVNLHGKWVLTLVIGADGRVKSVTITGPKKGKHTTFTAALKRIAKGLRFPKPVGGGTVTVRYPLIFKQG